MPQINTAVMLAISATVMRQEVRLWDSGYVRKFSLVH
jgi:hypothetical protein